MRTKSRCLSILLLFRSETSSQPTIRDYPFYFYIQSKPLMGLSVKVVGVGYSAKAPDNRPFRNSVTHVNYVSRVKSLLICIIIDMISERSHNILYHIKYQYFYLSITETASTDKAVPEISKEIPRKLRRNRICLCLFQFQCQHF